jgi:hypothetical protein
MLVPFFLLSTGSIHASEEHKGRSAAILSGSLIHTGFASAKYYAFNHRNGKNGHGFMAEHMNHFFDTMAGRRTLHLGMNTMKWGPDRRDDGINIQVKYCKTPEKTWQAVYKQGKLVYNEFGSVMMVSHFL